MAYRREQFKVYQQHLRALLRGRWPAMLQLADVAEMLDPIAAEARGQALKKLEDMLDALTCAYIARHAFLRGEGGIEIFGDFRTGAVAVPR